MAWRVQERHTCSQNCPKWVWPHGKEQREEKIKQGTCRHQPRAHYYPEPVNVTLFGEMVFANETTNFEMISPWIIQISPNPMTSILVRDRKEDTDTEGRKPGGDGVEILVMQPQAKESPEPTEAGRVKKWNVTWNFWKEHDLANTLTSDFWPPEQ